jgi:hypothetical protein
MHIYAAYLAALRFLAGKEQNPQLNLHKKQFEFLAFNQTMSQGIMHSVN